MGFAFKKIRTDSGLVASPFPAPVSALTRTMYHWFAVKFCSSIDVVFVDAEFQSTILPVVSAP